MKILSLMLLSLFLVSLESMAQKQSLSSELDLLGTDQAIVRRARALNPKNRVKVVQRRAVDRTHRLEFAAGAGMLNGGDPYINTQAVGGRIEYHVNPHWSLGVRYYGSSNTLSSEGRRIFEQAENSLSTNQELPSIDYPKSTSMGVISWYPLYGKLNLYDLGIAQFDFYLLAGYGVTRLDSGDSPTLTGGAGIGAWVNKHMSFRLEARYQRYKDHLQTFNREIDQTMLSASIGFLL